MYSINGCVYFASCLSEVSGCNRGDSVNLVVCDGSVPFLVPSQLGTLSEVALNIESCAKISK